MMISDMEDLANEIFYEIFDYLDGCDVYRSFSNLNSRFYQLLHSPLLLYKIKFHFESDDASTNTYQYLQPNQILSLHLSSQLHIDRCFSSFHTDASMHDHLQSICLEYIQSETLFGLLRNCIHLPRLTSLRICSCHQALESSQIYPLMFNLSKLKYLQFGTNDLKDSFSLPIADENQLSSEIEYLDIQHDVTFSQLATIMSYTPKLNRLEFTHEDENDPTVEMISAMELSKLTHVSMTIVYLECDQTEIFLRKLPSTLQILNFYVCGTDTTFLDFRMWEDLIQENFPQLQKFNYNYTVVPNDDDQFLFSDCMLDPFISPFWINRRWFVEVRRNREAISVVIKPYRYSSSGEFRRQNKGSTYSSF
jgi:hypothetical protein